ncbi:hypothetical protein AOLI_G00002410 [Acnodon oligacanthus]
MTPHCPDSEHSTITSQSESSAVSVSVVTLSWELSAGVSESPPLGHRGETNISYLRARKPLDLLFILTVKPPRAPLLPFKLDKTLSETGGPSETLFGVPPRDHRELLSCS